jgi:ABC-type branched-subunit amino acid transport system substrate-binding protein
MTTGSSSSWFRFGGRLAPVVAVAVAVAVAVVAAPTASAIGKHKKASHGTRLVEAVVTAFTGPESFIGGVLTAGAYPAVYEINAAGGVMGHDFSVQTVDTRGDPADALPLVERFLGSTSHIAGITGTDGATANQLLPLFNSHKLTITSDVGSSNFDHTKLAYFWRMIAPDPVNGLAMAEWAKKKGYTRVALVFGTDTSAQTDLPGIQYGIKHLHLSVVDNVSLNPDQPSYQSEAAQLIAAHPQVIFTEEDDTTAGTFFGDVAQLGQVPPIIGDSGTIENNWMSAVSTAIGGSTFAKNYTGLTSQPAPTTAAHRAWVKALQHSKAHVKSPITQWYNEPYAEASYDGVIMQGLAMLAAKNTSPAVYDRYMEAVTEPGRGKVKVYNFAAGKAALAAGKKIEYVGATGAVAFNKYHNFYGNQVAVQFPSATLGSQKIVGVVPASEIEAAG